MARRRAGGRNWSIFAERLKEWIRPCYLKWVYFPLRPEARPRQWVDCWRYPRCDLAREQGVAARQPDILILPMTDWHARMQRAQHLARALAGLGYRCFYLNPNLGREFPQPVWLSDSPRVCRLEAGVWEIHAGLVREPVFHHRMLTGKETRKVLENVEAIAKPFQVERLAVLCQFPLWNRLAVELRRRFGGPVIYDCHDLLSGFSRMAPEIIAAERELFEQADAVVVSAKSLLEKKVAEMPWLGEKARLVRNGVDVAHFQPVEGGRRKVVGYAGSLDEWFDVEAVRAAAEAHPECEFVFLGRIEDKKVLALEALRNVRFYGEIPYDRLPVYMAEFDAALIPFLITPLTLATNPIKLYEYFSCGLPVVSTTLPEVELYPELVYLAHSAQEFAAQVGRALAEQDGDLRAKRRKVAEQESWAKRAEQVAEVWEEGEARKAAGGDPSGFTGHE
jgi:glycosyltransferase involved in cell wall biosynthesis